jgi:nitrous oxidase accessory protein
VLQTATAPLVRGNSFVGNGIGVFFDNVVAGDFESNVVIGNWLGLELFANSERTRVTGNTILGNTFDAAAGHSADAFRLCVDGRGNYWGAATGMGGGYDLDGDGVLDLPHQASSPLAELALSRGSLRLFLGSPAARALDWAERTFPVFDVAQITDSCPLAVAPRAPALSQLPGAPAGSGRGWPLGQVAVAAGALLAGSIFLSTSGRRRRGRAA